AFQTDTTISADSYTVRGQGHIAWGPAGVTSTGAVGTDRLDLAAAFGPVTGLAGTIRFDDLLALRSAPHQRLSVASINPGVPVTDGVVTLQLLPGPLVQVEGAAWPFAGGALTLDPTLLDFAATARRRLTFHVAGARADQFLQSFDFPNLDATGTFDGALPMVFDADGGRIEGGRLAVRAGGGTIAYVGELTAKDLGFWGNLAFQTLRSLRYRSLDVTMDGPLAGEMVTGVRFAGVRQGVGARSNFVVRRLQRLPFVFNVRIRAPFRGLLDTTASFHDPRALIGRELPELLAPAVQPPASAPVPGETPR
ncbi:intermembrane phospholipid transport protein YdbH family protein, partial [Sphingomonas bacterium]|uniref:intermembrane phospholipid transport protein YdbH family protein n=1 Tax=Sphingomonas bacterium TaxID=1895847 RepID=UPI001576BD20